MDDKNATYLCSRTITTLCTFGYYFSYIWTYFCLHLEVLPGSSMIPMTQNSEL